MSIRTYRYVPPRRWQTYLRACLEILYPQYCPVCHHLLAPEMEGICPDCLLSLPLYHDKLLHAADRLEGGAFPFDQLLAGYQFSRNNAVQEVVHSIKYQRNRALGITLGRVLAHRFALSPARYDLLIPIATHPKREALRGYNQAEAIARGVSMASGIPVATEALIRNGRHSQTMQGREDRLRSMVGAFSLSRDVPAEGSRLLLVDDVLTTGATLVAAADTLALTAPESLTALVLAVDE